MSIDGHIHRIAITAYEAVRVWRSEFGYIIPEWDAAEPVVQEDVLARVKSILSDPGSSDSTFHNKWLINARKDGWTHGKEYDEKRRIDPLVVPFHLLSFEDKAKERLFRAVVLSLSFV